MSGGAHPKASATAHAKGDGHDAKPVTGSSGGKKSAWRNRLPLLVALLALGWFYWPEISSRMPFSTEARKANAERVAAAQRKLAEDAKFVQIRRVTVSVASGQAPLPVTFTAEVGIMPDASPVQCLWSFGDGSMPYPGQVRVAYTYATTGRFEARLTVIDAKGRKAVSEPVVIVTTGSLEARKTALPEGPAVAKREEQESPFSRMARGTNAWLDNVLPSEGKNAEPSEGVISLRVGDVPIKRTLRPGERSPWFKMVGSGRVRIQCDGPGNQRPEAWSEPAEDSRIWRFYNYDGVGEFSFYLVQER
jgi:hypothetical protein